MKAAFIGRFQPFHEGHKNVIEDYRDQFEDFCVIIGSSDKSRERENPLTADEREEIIRECFPDLEIVHVDDEGTETEEMNRKWIENVRDKTSADVIISQNSLVKRLVNEYTNMSLETQEMHDPEVYSGTEIRRRTRSGEEWRYLVPGCAEEKIEEHLEIIKNAGINYNFEPGWKRKNAYNASSDQ